MCGNTGVVNRGCEAIVRSTVKVLNKRSGDVYLATFAPEQDRAVSSQLGINQISYDNYPTSIHRYGYAAFRKVFKRSLVGYDLIEKPLFSRLKKDDVCLNIGGDVYCYSRPVISLALNDFTHKKGITNILWCCSIEKDNINKEILADLKKYSYIFAREEITCNTLREVGIDEKKIVRVCDPAFFLDMAKVELPQNFAVGNTVGINVSEMVINESNPQVYSNVTALIKYILDETDMNICFIPHVYSIKNNSNDYPILKKLYDEFKCDRVSFVDSELGCEQLKYIISKCRFFIGARTHSTIAAYSTEVPTLVLGYSVKSKGIATDLFGTYKDYVLPYGELTDNNELLAAFVKMVANEEKIKQRYAKVLPEYRQRLTDAIDKYIPKQTFERNFICDNEICTGCGACAARCALGCISMEADNEGFLRPTVDSAKCTNCGLCRKICPAANKFKDSGTVPETYAVINSDEKVRLSSSSGGVFSALAESVINRGGVVFGAALSEDMSVSSIACRNMEELVKLRGSKYVQNKVGDTYKEVKELLENGTLVLYTGTPCQIDGLYAYLGKDYETLYTQDIICHGVPSPKVWSKYVSEKENDFGAKAKEASFRDKRSGWQRYSLSINFDDKMEYIAPVTEDAYLRGFISHLYLRPSCGICSSKQIHRQSDITLADFWGIEKTEHPFNDGKGASAVMVHSKKGRALLEMARDSLKLEEADFEKVILNNPSYIKSSKPSKFRNSFFKAVEKKKISSIVNKYYGKGFAAKMRRAISKFI